MLILGNRDEVRDLVTIAASDGWRSEGRADHRSEKKGCAPVLCRRARDGHLISKVLALRPGSSWLSLFPAPSIALENAV